jgi:anti-anti-sigma factor
LIGNGGAVDISCRRIGRLTILDLSGPWTISPGETEVAAFRAMIARLIEDGQVHVGANLSALRALDAHGLGILAIAYTRLRKAGGELTLIAPNPAVRKMLAVTRLDTVIPIYNSEADVEADGSVSDAAECSVSSGI